MLNPITFTERVVGDFLRYQLTTYPFADERLYRQMRDLLNLEQTRRTPLMRGPYISLSRSFRQGSKIADLVAEGFLHPHISSLVPFPQLYGHQETAIRAVASGKTTLVSTGTGSGKTECFLYPIISRCLQLRDEGAGPGITAVIVYPMNALAEDQLGRLRELLAGTGITFGMYIGKTPEEEKDVTGERLLPGTSRADYLARLEQLRAEKRSVALHPPEERASRAEMRKPGGQPRILLTNVKQLELLLTRQQDIEMFDGARLEFLVFDEAHTFGGAAGAETACLIRRLRAFCGKTPEETVCVGTSATIADPKRGPEAGRNFASRFFGVSENDVELVGEEYEEEDWAERRTVTPGLPGDPAVHLQTILDVVSGVEEEPPSEGALRVLKSTFQTMTGSVLNIGRWQEDLYDFLSANETAFQIADILKTPQALSGLLDELQQGLGRPVPEEEILAWLALGAASRKGSRPLLRPVVHAFVRGVGGAVVTFPEGSDGPRLWLSAEDATDESGDGLYRLAVTTCTTCGQHYFVHFVADLKLTGAVPEGGEAIDDRVIWRPLEQQRGGKRVVLLDRLVSTADIEDEDDVAPRNTVAMFLCRFCGTLHPAERSRCDGCGMENALVAFYAVRQKEEDPGFLTSCLSCRATGGKRLGQYREPARPVRAVTVSDVHVLAQSMIQRAERKRLLVFSDNRQDAAFQAGWMADHARRFRLRSLMYQGLQDGPVSIGDLTGYLDDLLDKDDDLSRALIPEVWQVERKEASAKRHAQERRGFLRIQVLREVTTGARQRIGLEPWGRMRVGYTGLSADDPFFEKWAPKAEVTSEELRAGVAGLLDGVRRNRILLDREGRIFSKYWLEGDFEIQRGYMPIFQGGPIGIKLRRQAGDDKGRVRQVISERGETLFRHCAKRWDLPSSEIDTFLEELWRYLADEKSVLVPATLTGYSNRALPNCSGVYQIDADRLELVAHRGLYECGSCRGGFLRETPKNACLTWRCQGTLGFKPEDPDNYDLSLLDQDFAMIRPREHSAQVPVEEREILERAFKSKSELVNTLVCTPTLELGVDIGALDSVLMRNVPPLPANYWQRAGRAGRRHRMAVNLTYARPASHDRAYFSDPLKMLAGLIQPPSFNLRNEVMVRKHVHATVLTILYALARPGSPLSQSDVEELGTILNACFPPVIRDYLFDPGGLVRSRPLEVTVLNTAVSKHEDRLVTGLVSVFEQGWPAEDSTIVRVEALRGYLREMAGELKAVVRRLHDRLQWALRQMARLDEVRAAKGTLDPEEDALRQRCDRLIKRLKGVGQRRRRDSEGYDDIVTYGVLAAEGFLPGYGLDTGAILGHYQAPRFIPGMKDWDLRRPTALALREYVPGNLIYANRHRFLPRYFHLEAVQPTLFQVDLTNEAVMELGAGEIRSGAGFGSKTLPAIPICDLDLPHHAQINDEEDYRFQMPVSVYGYQQPRHGEGKAYTWGGNSLLYRKAVHLRLVNVGSTGLIRSVGALGYPVCLVCGQSRSPLAASRDLEEFAKDHRSRCGKDVRWVGFSADVIADALCLQNCRDRTEAYSVMETLRAGARQVLEMELEDLQLLAVGRSGEQVVDMLLYDPMPGGSGLLEQMLERWPEVVAAAAGVAEDCPGECETACVDCLMTFRNAYYHRFLDRGLAATQLGDRGDRIVFSHDIPARLPANESEGKPVNVAESQLKAMLIKAGFAPPEAQKRIELGRPLGSTVPDFFYEDPSERFDGVCIYLDGMSGHLHGNPETREKDRAIREELRGRGYEVIEIAYGQLSDPGAMQRHFYRLGRILLGRDRAERIRANPEWMDVSEEGSGARGSDRAGEPAWKDILDLVDDKWRPVAEALRQAGIPAPTDVGFDLMVDGVVSGKRAVMVWRTPAVDLLLVEGEGEPRTEEGRIVAPAESDPAVLVELIRSQLESVV